MRDILEALPGALFPDLQKESEDPGVESVLLGDDLVRPSAEDELPHIHRGRKSPLSRHLVHVVDPLDCALPVPIGLRLGLEGARITDAVIDTGYTHQGLERRALGLRVDAAHVSGLFRLVARAAPAVVAEIALAVTLERASSTTPSPSTTWQRQVALDLVTVADALRVLSAPQLSHDTGHVRDAARAAHALVDAVAAGDAFAGIGRVRRGLASEERATIARQLDDVERVIARIDVSRAFAHLSGVGRLDARAAKEKGVEGAVLRACGVDDDALVDIDAGPAAPASGKDGDVIARLRVRHADALLALPRVRRRLATSEDADDDNDVPVVCRDGIHVGAARGPGGSLAVLLSLREGVVERLRLRPPDIALIAALPRALAGVALDDAAAVIASFGIHISAVDR